MVVVSGDGARKRATAVLVRSSLAAKSCARLHNNEDRGQRRDLQQVIRTQDIHLCTSRRLSTTATAIHTSEHIYRWIGIYIQKNSC